MAKKMPKGLDGTVARNLSGLRRKAKLSQEALARAADLSVSYISMLERGQRSPPLATLAVLARVLKVEPAYLLQELDWK